MMQEYDDDFFFEEDKIKQNENTTSNLLVEVEETATVSFHESPKDIEEGHLVEENPKEEKGQENVTEIESIYNDLRKERYMIYHQDLLGMTVTSGSVVLSKDEKNLIGISIGGGAPLCPCLYIVQIFDNTPASKEGTLQSGDELVGVNGQSVKGKTKVEVARMIQGATGEVTINYNKLHADPKQGRTLDIIMKKMKHRLVENMSSGAADALGLSRAILCNDTLVAKLDELKETEVVYRKLVDHAKRMLKSYFDLLQTYKTMGDIFASIGVKEPQARASEAFTKFGQYHRQLEKDGITMLKTLKPILADLGTYLNKAIPDTKLTIRKYADTKFEYLSYCLKVKEMDDAEYTFNALQEPLYRVESGNYEYRLILRCRSDARSRFARLRSDVLVKLELLDNKKTQDVAYQLRRFITGFAAYHEVTLNHLKEHESLFPIEVDLSQNAFQYKSTAQMIQDSGEDDEEIEFAKELKEYHDIVENEDAKDRKADNRRPPKEGDATESSQQLLPDFDTIDSSIADGTANGDEKREVVDNLSLLKELGLADISEFGDFQNGMEDFVPKDSESTVDDVFEKLLSDL